MWGSDRRVNRTDGRTESVTEHADSKRDKGTGDKERKEKEEYYLACWKGLELSLI